MDNKTFLDYDGLLYFYSLLNNKFLKSETDPTVPAWAKAPTKPSYTISEINGGASTASPEFTGIPTAPTAAAGTNTTQIATTEFVSTAVSNAMAGVTSISYEVIAAGDDLPLTGTPGVIYLKPNSGASGNSYDEYIWVNNTYELLSQKELDLSNYWNGTNLVAMTNEDIDSVVYPYTDTPGLSDAAQIKDLMQRWVNQYNAAHSTSHVITTQALHQGGTNIYTAGVSPWISGHSEIQYDSTTGKVDVYSGMA